MPADPNLITFFGSTTTVDASEVYFGGDHISGTSIIGVYSVEVRAFADQNFDTGEFETLQITVINPCLQPLVTPSTPLGQITYFVGSGEASYDIQAISAQ